MELRWEVTSDDDAASAALREGVIAYNSAARPALFPDDLDVPRLTICVRDAAGRLVGGVTAEIEWNHLHIEFLWVDEAARGRGLGRALVERLEAEARTRGCTRASLTTYDFQAPDFYRKLGYEVFGTLEDYPPGHMTYFMRHDFGNDVSGP